MESKYTENLFSYGTLQYEKVQIDTFGRKLTGKMDSLPGYFLEKLQITDAGVIAKSGEDVHSIVQFSGDPQDLVPGVVFQVSLEELLKSDEYEVAEYARIQVQLLSGIFAWVYVSAKKI
ncbi:MAG: gamma-glutamylcyclotransferase [Rhabdochlamydiaceae bacterium]|nr:gamma-glutamylcyclotransferase [Rhabdochlamydiaceae bacterium]